MGVSVESMEIKSHSIDKWSRVPLTSLPHIANITINSLFEDTEFIFNQFIKKKFLSFKTQNIFIFPFVIERQLIYSELKLFKYKILLHKLKSKVIEK